MTKILNCGKKADSRARASSWIRVGPFKANAKRAAMAMAHGFANLVAASRAAEFKCPTKECGKMVLKLLTRKRELLTVKTQDKLYLSVVRRSFDIVIFCQ